MGNNSLYNTEKNLRTIAKRYENVKYSVGLAVLFLMKGTSAFSDENKIQEVEKQKEVITNDQIAKSTVKEVKKQETKKVKTATQKPKASWTTMQFGANDMYSNFFVTPKSEVEKTSIVKSEKTVLVASADNSTSLPMLAKLSSDIETIDTPTMEEIKTSKENLRDSVGNLKDKIDVARRENNKEINGLRLELIQLMEQGNQVVKSPWSSWQFGANYFYENWGSSYKGRGDKKEKYPFEGVYTRSDDLFLRNVSPDSELYGKYIKTTKDDAINSALSSTLLTRGRSTSYGLASNNGAQEPITTIELGASVKPKNISKSPITVLAPVISVAAVTPLLTPEPPDAPTPPVIKIPVFNPVAPEKITVSLPTPPTFNIKLGSYRNYMTQNFLGDVDGGRHSGSGQSYNASDTQTIDGSTLTQTAIYSWASPSAYVTGAKFDSALLKAYFDYTRLGGTGGGTSPLFTALMIDKFKKANVDTKIVLMTIMPTIKEGNSAQDNTQLFYRELFNTMPDLTYMVYDNNKFVNDYGPAALLNEVNLDIVDDIAILSGAYQFTTQYDSIDKQESIILNSTPGRLAVLKLYDIKEKDLDNLTLDDLLLSGMDKCSLADLQRDRDIVSRGVISNLNESLTKKFNFNMPKITEVLGEPIESFQHVYVNSEANEPNNLFVILGGLSAPNDRLQKTLERAAEIREMHETKSKKPNIFDDHDISGSNSLRQKALKPDTYEAGNTSDDDIFSRFGV